MGDAVESTLCTNCKHDILSSNFTIHTIHCQRNIYLCSKCDEPVNRGQQAEHDESYHTSTFCKSCHIQLEKWKLSDHLTNDCPKRKTKCKICEIETAVSDIGEHENYCGARTEKCMECGEFVMLKYKQLHLDSNHTFIKLSDEPGPSPSWQNGRRYLGNFLSEIDSGNHKSQSNQKKKVVQNRLKNSIDDAFEIKKVQNEAAGQYSNEKNNVFQSNQTKKSMPTSPNETALGAVRKTIAPKYTPPLVTNKIFDNTDQDVKSKTNDKGLNKGVKKLNTDNDHLLELDRLIALQISEDGDDKEKEMSEAERRRLLEEQADLLLAFKINDELNNKAETANDHLIAQQISEDLANDRTLNTGFLMDTYEKITDDSGSFKNIFKDKNETKTTRKSDFSKYKDDLEDEFLIYTKKDIDKNESQDISLPCEFCEKMIPIENLFPHQEGCNFKKNDIYNKFNFSLEKQEKVECSFCGKEFEISRINAHEGYCLQAIKYKDESRKSWKAEKTSNLSSNRKSLNSKINSPLPNGLDLSLNQGFAAEYYDSPKNNNDKQKNLKRNQSSGESTGAVPRTQRSRKNRRAPPPPNT